MCMRRIVYETLSVVSAKIFPSAQKFNYKGLYFYMLR
jgi:hypothetical protein